jgi:hypothetical protein
MAINSTVFFRDFDFIGKNPYNFSVAPGCDWIARSLMLQQSLPNRSGKSAIHAFAVVKELADIFLYGLLHYEFTPRSFAQISGSCTSVSIFLIPLAIRRGPDTVALS